MLRVSPFLLAASAAALPTTYLRPLERDLRDMEAEIKALNAKAAHKGLRLEKASKIPTKLEVYVISDHGTLKVQFPTGSLEEYPWPKIVDVKTKIAEATTMQLA